LIDLTSSQNATQKKNPGTIVSPKCKDPELYEGPEWCGLIKSANSPWKSALKFLNKATIDDTILGCSFDLCALEGNKKQREYFCKDMEHFNDRVLNRYHLLTKKKTQFSWRIKANCPKLCKKNQVYEIRSECPKNCLYPNGKYKCGLVKPVEGCHCKKGFVRNSKEECVKEEECGCKAENETYMIPYGKQIINNDCTEELSCEEPNGKVKTKKNQTMQQKRILRH